MQHSNHLLALKRRHGYYQRNETSFDDQEEEDYERPVRKKREAETSADCRDKTAATDMITGVVAEPGKTVNVPCRFW